MPAGRPPIEITEELIQRAYHFAAQGLTEEQIAGCLGMHQDTLIEKKKRFPELTEAIKEGKAAGIQRVANVVFNRAIDGDMTAAIFYLKARAQWSDRPAVALSDGQEFTIKMMTPTQFKAAANEPETSD